ncbi:glycosyltransferase [Leptospira biflexa]|uniref:glycosyltransferase n=1 Tax=Leptospira biflexa TaxID=172 RepID=UPI0010912561|nr:glycosyltransferase [Leptospira biflexa]TGM46498.1 glycosyltransferase [Leptospira biflexa]TGM51040.1 glycosyltransferase [Leptospira biflexa]
MKKNHLSIIIPCYNECNRLPQYLDTLMITFQKKSNVDFIIVDDGSPKKEFLKLKENIEHHLSNPKIQLLRYELNLGKGGAIQFGLQVAKGNYVGFVDADGATPAYELQRIWDHIDTHKDIDLIVGSRIPMLGRSVKKSFYRHIANRVFSYYFHKIFKIQMYDPQCGCKIFKKSLYETMREKITDLRWLWDTQLIVLSYRNQKKIFEFPIDWNEIPDSKFNFLKDSWVVLYSAWKYRNII